MRGLLGVSFAFCRMPQILVDEGNRHTSLTHRGSDAFDGAQPNVPTRVNAGNACFEEIGIAGICPLSSLDHIRSGKNISAGISGNFGG